MNRQKKQQLIKTLSKNLTESHFYITDSQGLDANQAGQMRELCYKQNIKYQVVKNTLLKKALDLLPSNIDYAPLQSKALKGFTSIFITKQEASQPAKIIQEFQKTRKSEKPSLKAAVVEGELYIGSTHLTALSKLKSKQILIAELVSLLKSPIQVVLTSLQSSKNNLAGIVQALSDRANN